MDWGSSYSPTWAFYLFDPDAWRDARRLGCVTSCRIVRDLDADLRESATLVTDEPLGDEAWVRVYLDAEQGGRTERFCVATLVCQSPHERGDGANTEYEAECYGALIELADDAPGIDHVTEGDAGAAAAREVSLHSRLPCEPYEAGAELDAPVAAWDSPSWLDHERAVLAKAGLSLECDEYGRAVVCPQPDAASMRPAWEFAEGDGSLLLDSHERESDMAEVHNVCEVVWSEGARQVVGRAENADPESPSSTASLGRRKLLRVESPDELQDGCTQEQADACAERLLREDSALTVTYTVEHDFCPVRIGQCVRLRHAGADAVALVARQEIECDTSCRVTAELRSRKELMR